MISVRIQKIYDEILEETNLDLVVIKDRKTYRGALFFPKESFEKLRGIVDRMDFADDTDIATIIEACYLMFNDKVRKSKDDRTFLTMAHWQYVNGFSRWMCDTWNYKNDSEYFAK